MSGMALADRLARVVGPRRGKSKTNARQKYTKRWLLMWAQNCRCAACDQIMDPDADPLGKQYPTLDHVVAFARGGPNATSNLLLKHRRCNEMRADRPATAKDRRALAAIQAIMLARPQTGEDCEREARAILATERARAAL